MNVNEVMERWIKDTNEGRIKIGKRELGNDELADMVRLLQCVAADLLMCQPAAPAAGVTAEPSVGQAEAVADAVIEHYDAWKNDTQQLVAIVHHAMVLAAAAKEGDGG